ncbi:hypothetical protein EYF80_062750 [Liparis tanakae]|uniref:Uncharacterized protein n=1 Tax=Liparis tanakae TaxID=230148 RepID=A0A4Z2EDZ0_9TELE|nr:hypothetical protein EYF80_062750 [Liparis tanakae]
MNIEELRPSALPPAAHLLSGRVPQIEPTRRRPTLEI